MKYLLFFAFFSIAAFGQTTQIIDNVTTPAGHVFAGTISITSHNFVQAGTTLPPKTTYVQVTAGKLNTILQANTPYPNSYYTAVFTATSPVETWTQTWVVPTSPYPVNIARILQNAPVTTPTLSFSAPFTTNGSTISLPQATNAVSGYLSAADWIAFNAKQGALTFSGNGTVVPHTLGNFSPGHFVTTDVSTNLIDAGTTLTLNGGIVAVSSGSSLTALSAVSDNNIGTQVAIGNTTVGSGWAMAVEGSAGSLPGALTFAETNPAIIPLSFDANSNAMRLNGNEKLIWTSNSSFANAGTAAATLQLIGGVLKLTGATSFDVPAITCAGSPCSGIGTGGGTAGVLTINNSAPDGSGNFTIPQAVATGSNEIDPASTTTTGFDSANVADAEITGSAYTVVGGDRGHLKILNGTAAQTVFIPQACSNPPTCTGSSTPFRKGFWLEIYNKSAYPLTLTPSTSAINQTVLAPGHWGKLFDDGTKYIFLLVN